MQFLQRSHLHISDMLSGLHQIRSFRRMLVQTCYTYHQATLRQLSTLSSSKSICPYRLVAHCRDLVCVTHKDFIVLSQRGNILD